jgi:hypothetical protein
MKEPVSIGQRQSALLASLLGEFEAVRSVADRDFSAILYEQRAKLRAWRARISGIGQVKAGKSTFLSALIGKPGFLPAEVNPWTAVVTNLHCGHPDDPTEGGVFHFFAEDDWLRIIEGDAKTRELAKELLPGFDPETLRQQVETMRARAKQRLGNFYSVLLGTSHTYDRITNEMLQRYVCAGSEFETSSDRTGRYSDITERADIYLPKGRWDVPTVVTDTPGVNDPFLVRDEFTCRSLLKSDIFILLLSVHQALTDVDMALVRMVSEHPEKQILVVINRIDELENFAEAAPKIRQDVADRLKDSGLSLRDEDIILASAAWAELLLDEETGAERVAEVASTPELGRYLSQYHGAASDDPHEKVWVASGMAKVSEAIDHAISSGSGHRVLQDNAEVLSTLVQNLRNQIKTSRSKAIDLKSAVGSDGELPADARNIVALHTNDADQLAEDLESQFNKSKEGLNEILDKSWRAIRRELDLGLTGFIDEEAVELRAIVRGESRQEKFDFDTFRLRDELMKRARDGFMAARQNLDNRLHGIAAEIRQMTSRMFTAGIFDAGLDALPNEDVTLIAAETPKTLTLDLVTARGWRFWANSRMNEDEALQALKQIIRAEFHSVIDTLSTLVNEALVERAFEALGRLEAMTGAMVEAVKKNALDLSLSSNGPDDQQALLRIEQTISDMDERIELLDQVDSRLRDMLAGAARDEPVLNVAKDA